MELPKCDNRDYFSQNMSDYIKNSPSNSFQFVGGNGSGKKYVLNKIENLIQKEFELYRIISDSIVKKGENIPTHTFNVIFSLTNFVGMSLSYRKNDDLKINYIITNLKSLTRKKKLIISATNYEILPSESRDFINVLLCNKNFIEEKTKRKITVIITSNFDYFYNKYGVKTINFKDYSKKDTYNFLIKSCGCSTQELSGKNLNKIIKLCGYNFNLIREYASYIIKNENCITSINNVVETKLNYYIRNGINETNLSKEILKDILYAASMCISMLNPQMISFINRYNDEKIAQKGFECAISGHFLQREFVSYLTEFLNFSFISFNEKQYLSEKAKPLFIDKTQFYYVFVTEKAEDEYFERAQYLFQFYGTINQTVFALVILGVSKSFLLNDSLERNQIKEFFYQNNTNGENIVLFDIIIDAYQYHYNSDYKKSNIVLDTINFTNINPVLSAELRRLRFINNRLGHNLCNQELNMISNMLKAHLKQGIILTSDFTGNVKNEKILSLRIIYDLAPYVLDHQKDIEGFNHLYDQSLILVEHINKHFIRKSYCNYIVNVFNRKAFLFAAPAQASIYYEQAVSYFENNSIWDEYVISLASKAGNEIALHKYSQAINDCNLALNKIIEYDLTISQKEKILNNLYIAEFLYFESNEENNLSKIQEKAIETTAILEKLIENARTPCATKHVILTNLSALYLYANKDEKYIYTKKRIENSLGCKDVSNIKDVSTSDFYRYHFAWYEFYRNLKYRDLKKCKNIANSLKSFYPSIFHNYEKMDLRVEAAIELVKTKCVPDTKLYMLNMLKFAPSNKGNYSSRGLPLSDLQFTSYE